MMTPARIVRLIGIIALIGWLGLVGWVAKSIQAQNGGHPKQVAPPPSSEETASRDVAPLPAVAPATAPRSTSTGEQEPTQVNSAALSVPKLAGDEAQPQALPGPAPGDKLPVTADPVAEGTSGAAVDDPEQSAQAFFDRSRKEAEMHLKTLTFEAERLRTRLTKLESGIKKWENLVNALKVAQHGQPTAASVAAPRAEEAGDLEPIKTAAPGPRSDKRVKWANVPGTAAASAAPAGETGPNQASTGTQPAVQPSAQPTAIAPAGSMPR
jgi:hypothetical protein